jgi:hypothetical protein
MALLSGLSVGVILLFILLEVGANSVGLYAASRSLAGFKFKSYRVLPLAAGIYTVLHILGGFFLAKVLNLGIFSGTGLLVGYLIDVALLWATDKAIKDFEIESKEALFTGAFLIIFCWGIAWYIMLIGLGAAGVVDLKPVLLK